MTTSRPPFQRHRIPLAAKLAFTAFMCVLVPFYLWAYGPTNFLYFCDVALFLTLLSIWTEHPLPAGMATVGILIPQMLWVIDFLGGMFGMHVTGMTAYMFRIDSAYILFTRGLSLFHGWLPFLLVYIVYRLGYDRRSFPAWTLLAWGLMLVCYFLMPGPPAPSDNPDLPVNINYVFGPGDEKAQEWMPPHLWLGLLIVAFPVVFYAPTHLLMRRMPVWRPGTQG